MANVSVEDQKLLIKLSPTEKIESLRFHDFAIDISNVVDAYTTQSPFDELSGLRVGTGIPRVICVGTWYGGRSTMFAAIHGNSTAIVVSLRNEKITKVVATIDNAVEIARTIRGQI
ncbi:MAG: hypothetical protein M0Z45_00925 [Actinomycetota bacterium]|nr:hypothetical protein [Actinomycetota bacterium]